MATSAADGANRTARPAALATLLLAVAACAPLPFGEERTAVLEVTSTRPGAGAVVEVAAAEAESDGEAWPHGPVETPYRRSVSPSRAAVMVRVVSGPAVRVRLRARSGDDLRHEVETTTSDVALVTGGWRYLPGSWVSSTGF